MAMMSEAIADAETVISIEDKKMFDDRENKNMNP